MIENTVRLLADNMLLHFGDHQMLCQRPEAVARAMAAKISLYMVLILYTAACMTIEPSGRDSYKMAAFVGVPIFVLALCLPALYFKHSPGGTWTPDVVIWSGFDCWFETLVGPICGQWEGLSNLFLFTAMALLYFRHPLLSMLLSAIALLVSVQTLSLYSTWIPMDEGLVEKVILFKFGVGFYLWIASMICTFLAGAFLFASSLIRSKVDRTQSVQ